MATYWEERARILAERDAAVEPPAPAPKRAKREVEPQPAAEPPADSGLNPKE